MVSKTKIQTIVKADEVHPPINYNNKTELSYGEIGFAAPEDLDQQEKNFLNLVDVTKKPIERMVTKIIRIKAIDHNSPKKERKDFLMWYENWYGVDWQGATVSPVTDHVEGRYQKQSKNPVVKQGKIVGYSRGPETTVYYIPFSRTKVDEIIAGSVGTDRDTIRFVVSNGVRRNDSYSYEQFVNLSFEDCIKLMNQTGGPEMTPYHTSS